MSLKRYSYFSRSLGLLISALTLFGILVIAHGASKPREESTETRAGRIETRLRRLDRSNAALLSLTWFSGEKNRLKSSHSLTIDSPDNTHDNILDAEMAIVNGKADAPLAARFAHDRPEKAKAFEEEGEQLLLDRIRWFKERHPEIE